MPAQNTWQSKLKFSGWFSPYDHAPGEINPRTKKPRKYGRTAKQLRDVVGVPGVYAVAIKGKVVYVGKTEDSLHKIITRKYQQHTDTDLPYDRFRVDPAKTKSLVNYVAMPGNTPAQIANVEQALIDKHQPKYNRAGRFDSPQQHMVNKEMLKRAGGFVYKNEPDPKESQKKIEAQRKAAARPFGADKVSSAQNDDEDLPF